MSGQQHFQKSEQVVRQSSSSTMQQSSSVVQQSSSRVQQSSQVVREGMNKHILFSSAKLTYLKIFFITQVYVWSIYCVNKFVRRNVRVSYKSMLAKESNLFKKIILNFFMFGAFIITKFLSYKSRICNIRSHFKSCDV